MKVSIIIPTYNRAHLIHKAIKAVLAQTYENWELLIIDDGSSDNTLDIVNSFLSDNRIQYFKITNGGVSKARNYGIEMSIGEYILFLDSDDEITEQKLALHIQLFQKDPKIDVTVSQALRITHSNNERHHLKNIRPITSLQTDFISKKISWKTHAPIWKRKFLIEEKGFDEKLRSSEDYEFYSRLVLQNPRVKYIMLPLSIINDYSKKEDAYKLRGQSDIIRSLKNHIRSRNSVRLSLQKKGTLSFRTRLRIQRYLLQHLFYCLKKAFKISPGTFAKLSYWYILEGKSYVPTFPKEGVEN